MKLLLIATNAVFPVMYMLIVLMMPAIFYLSNVNNAEKNMKAAVLKIARHLFIYLLSNRNSCEKGLIKDKIFSIKPKQEKKGYLQGVNNFTFQTRPKVLQGQYCRL